MKTADIIVIGGGIIGAAVGYGLARRGRRVAIIDQGDMRHRASVGNFGLVWVQGKGVGKRPYTLWSVEASERFPDFAAQIEQETGVALHYRRTGGIVLCHSGKEYDERSRIIEQLRAEAGVDAYACDMLTRDQVQAMMPKLRLGDDIVGGSYSPYDGHLNPLSLLHGLYRGYYSAGGRHYPGQTVTQITRQQKAFTVETEADRFTAAQIVLAAGLGAPALASQVGLALPLRPQRGQLLVTERTQPMLDLPLSGLRQTEEGSFLIGLSTEEVGFDLHTTLDVQRNMARRILQAFPSLVGLRIVRSWAALRILTPDVLPIYHESETCPGAYVITSHSGVTLAPMHAMHIVNWILDGRRPDVMQNFTLRRFDVQNTS